MIKADVKEEDKKMNTYPRLMKGSISGDIYLMTKEQEGILLSGSRNNRIGTKMSMLSTEPFHGEITLKNE